MCIRKDAHRDSALPGRQFGFGQRIEEAVVYRETPLERTEATNRAVALIPDEARHRLAAPGNHDLLARLQPHEKA